MNDRKSNSVQDKMKLMASTITSTANVISNNEVDACINELLTAERTYVLGAGRSGLVAKAFAMRLMHLGLRTYVVGETITPAMKEGDTIVAYSGSGETKSIAEL